MDTSALMLTLEASFPCRSMEVTAMMTRRILVNAGIASLAVAAGIFSRTPSFRRRAFRRDTYRCRMAQAPDPSQYAVLARERHRARLSPVRLLNEHRKGTFACAGCELELFSSTTKFESGTGWPSFWAPLEEAVGTPRTTVLSAWSARRCIAGDAAAISAMSSMMGRSRPGCAIA